MRTDDSGIQAPIVVALHQMNIPFLHEFSSEIDRHCLRMIAVNFTLVGDRPSLMMIYLLRSSAATRERGTKESGTFA